MGIERGDPGRREEGEQRGNFFSSQLSSRRKMTLFAFTLAKQLLLFGYDFRPRQYKAERSKAKHGWLSPSFLGSEKYFLLVSAFSKRVTEMDEPGSDVAKDGKKDGTKTNRQREEREKKGGKGGV